MPRLCLVLVALDRLFHLRPGRPPPPSPLQGRRTPEVPSQDRGHGRGHAPGRVREAARDGEGVTAPRAALPQRGPGGAGRARGGHRVARGPSRDAAGGLRLGRPVAHGEPRRELDAAVRRRVLDHHRRLRHRRRRRAGPLRRHRREQLEPYVLLGHGRLQEHRRRPDLAQRGPDRLPPHRPRGGGPARPADGLRGGRSAISTPRTTSGASTRRRTAGEPGPASCSRTSVRAPWTSRMDPSRPDVLYAAMWEKARTAANFLESGPGSGLWKSTDAGGTWSRLEGGLPTGATVGRIGLAVAASRPADPLRGASTTRPAGPRASPSTRRPRPAS